MTLNFKNRVIIIDDDRAIQTNFSLIVNGSPHFSVVKTYDNCEDAINNLKYDKPEIVLMDIGLPGMNGIQGVKKIREKYPNIQIIMFTSYEEIDFVVESLKAGASGFITKSGNYLEVINALEEIVEGGAPLSRRIARMLVETFRINSYTPLTQRETEVLQLIAQGKTYAEISAELFVAKETSKTHIKNIYDKLNVHCRSEAIATANHKRLI